MAAAEYFRGPMRYIPVVLGAGMDESELQIWRHAGHNDAAALHVRPGKTDLCFVFDEPAQIRDLIEILQGMVEAMETARDG